MTDIARTVEHVQFYMGKLIAGMFFSLIQHVASKYGGSVFQSLLCSAREFLPA